MIIGISGKKQSGKDLVGKIIQYLTTESNPDTQEFIEKYHKPDINIENPSWEIKKFASKVKEILSLLTGIPVEDMEKEKVKNSYLGDEWTRWKIQWYENSPKNWADHRTTYHTTDLECLSLTDADYIGDETYPHVISSERITVRQALQQIGTDLFRDKFHANTWVNALFSNYIGKEYSTCNCGFINPNCMHEDEVIYPNWIITDLRFENEAQAVLDRTGILIRVNRENPLIKIAGGGDNKAEEYVRAKFKKIEAKLEHSSETSLDTYDKSVEELIEKVREILLKEKLI